MQQLPKVFRLVATVAAFLLPTLCIAAPKSNTGASAPKTTAAPNQHDLQVLSREVNDKGSDESLKNSTVFAMQALMDLSQTKLSSAVKNGYQAYGKYRNSENLDRMKDINALNANSLQSIGSGSVTLPTKTNTTFRRIDPSFLHKGEAGRVAAEFERLSGMKRESFLTQMADVSEFKIKRSDPQMVEKAFGQLEKFIDKIPNAEFRKNVEKNIHLVPETARRGMVAQAVNKLAGFFADAGSAAIPVESTISEKSTPQLASKTSSASAAPAAPPQEARKPAGTPSTAEAAPAAQPSSANKNALGSVVLSVLKTQVQEPSAVTLVEEQAAPQLTDDELTIFQQVTKRYRILTPTIALLP